MLMAAGLPLPEHVFVHGFLLIGEDKMSKSAGNALDPFPIIDEYGTDALRFYLMREVSFGHDGAVSIEGFAARYESELANDLGNLASRTIAMVHRYRDGVVPAAELDPALAAEIDGLDGEVCALLDRADLTGAGEAIWLRVRRLNRYVEERAPWTLAKDPERAGELDSVLASLAESLRVVAVLLHPWIPESSDKLLAALGAPSTLASRARACRPAGSAPSPSSTSSSRSTERRGARVIDSHTHLHVCKPDDADLVAAAVDAGREADAHRRHERRDLPRGAAGRRALPAGVRRDRPPSQRGDRLRRRRPRRADRARRASALRRDRRDRPGLLPRLRAARRPGARLRRADRAGARDRQAARHPHPRRRRRHDRHAARAGRRPRR